jgi:hypothetical protein
MKRIVWFSRHNPTPRQLQALKASFGADLELIWDKKPFASAAVILKRCHKTKPDDIVIVAPLSIIHALIQRGVQPLRAVMEVCEHRHPHTEYLTCHRAYRFVRFERITRYSFTTEPLATALPQPASPSFLKS